MGKKYLTFNHFTLLVAITISTIAAWYSVIGLTTIFAGAVVPIIIMGTALEVAKITTTVWLHRYWRLAGATIKAYLTTAVIILACITSMGIFGLLSKAHLEQGVTAGGVTEKLAILDEKIKTQRDNIELARAALKQLDAQVDARLSRGDSEAGAERAVQIRRGQAQERSRLSRDISNAQQEISKLTEERIPLAAQVRQVEAEVGPIKYIAALVYGGNPDSSTLENAVRWIIIMLVAVFDPLAIILILAANYGIRWDREKISTAISTPVQPLGQHPEELSGVNTTNDHHSNTQAQENIPVESVPESVVVPPVDETTHSSDYSTGDYQQQNITFTGFREIKSELIDFDTTTPTTGGVTADSVEQAKPVPPDSIKTEGVTNRAVLFSTDDEYVVWDGKKIRTSALRELNPGVVVDGPIETQILFGVKFPTVARTGDIYTRVDVTPHKTYKFNGTRWILMDREESTTYLQNIAYLQFLISKLDSGEYDPELLTSVEQEEISEYLKHTG